MCGQYAKRIFIKCLPNQPTKNGSGGCLIGWLVFRRGFFSVRVEFLRSIVIASHRNNATLLGANFTNIRIVAITMRFMQECVWMDV